MRIFLTIFFFLATNLIYSQNLSTLGPYLKDDNSNNVILRGINLGGWMLQEPYLFQFTEVIISSYSYQEKVGLIESLWKVAYSDNQLDKYEEHMVRRIADLLYVAHSDFMQSKNRIKASC